MSAETRRNLSRALLVAEVALLIVGVIEGNVLLIVAMALGVLAMFPNLGALRQR